MRTVAEYVAKATEYRRRAAREHNPAYKKRYEDLANSYQFMADERRRMIDAGEDPETPSRPN